MSKPKAVITGLGLVTSIGQDVNEFWKNCIGGKNGITPIEREGIELFEAHNGGQIKDPIKRTGERDNKLPYQKGRGCELLMESMRQALDDAKISPESIDCVYVGTTMGETTIDFTLKNDFYTINNSFDMIRHNSIKNLLADALYELDIEAEGLILCNACSSGNYALVTAYEMVRNGFANVVLVGGVDPFSSTAYYGFSRLNSVASAQCKPFSKTRDGMLVAEGSACLIVENEEHARLRRASIIAEIAGYGVSSDAFHITAPHSEGKGILEATNNALLSAGIRPEEVDFISAHGTGTIVNDKIESKVINEIFGKYKVPISSTKSMLGHTMGAASAIEAITCCLAIRDKIIPPTINFEVKDEECDVNIIANMAKKHNVKVAINNSYAFGGSNASVVFKEYLSGGEYEN